LCNLYPKQRLAIFINKDTSRKTSSNVSLIKRYTPEVGTMTSIRGSNVQWMAHITLDQKPTLFIILLFP